jgi:hypothetical protein
MSPTWHILTTASMKTTAFWDIAPSGLQKLRDILEVFPASYHQGDEWLIAVMMKAVSASETSVKFYETTEKTPRRQSSSTVIYFKFQPAYHLSIAVTYTLKTALLIYLRIVGLSSGLAVTCTGSSMHLSWFVVNVIDIETLPAPSHSSL